MTMRTNKRSRRGQAMLISVLALGGAILGATAIAGLLMLNRIRSTTDTQHSANAIFAADAGVEWAKYVYYCQFAASTSPNFCPSPSLIPSTTVAGASISVTCYSSGNTTTPCYATTTTSTQYQATYGITVGNSLNSARAFFVDISGATSAMQ